MWVLDAQRARSRPTTIRSSLRWTVLGLLLLVGVGVLGLMAVEGWSFLDALFMIVITISTIGYGEVQPLSDDGRWFMIGFIMTGLGVSTHLLSTTARAFIDGSAIGALIDGRHIRELRAMKDHHVVVGYGRLGREIVADLLHHGAQVVVIDSTPIADLPEAARAILGDATDDQVLDLAGVRAASGLAVATASDAVNVFITLSARQMAPNLRIVTRLEDERGAAKALRAGATQVLLPFHIAGGRMAQTMLRPGASAFVEHATHRAHDDLALEDLVVAPASPLVGQTLRGLGLRVRFGVNVVAIRHPDDDQVGTPDPDDPIRAGDVLVTAGPPAKVAELLATCTGRKA